MRGPQVGEDRKWSYKIVFGEVLQCQIGQWGHKLPSRRVLNDKVVRGHVCATRTRSVSLTVRAAGSSFGSCGFVCAENTLCSGGSLGSFWLQLLLVANFQE